MDGSKSSTKKREEKGHAGNLGESPAGPLKNYHKGYLADPNGLRDTPLVPKGTVADMYNIPESVYQTLKVLIEGSL